VKLVHLVVFITKKFCYDAWSHEPKSLVIVTGNVVCNKQNTRGKSMQRLN